MFQTVFSEARQAGLFSSPAITAYWAYHLARTGFLAMQGISGVLFACSALPVLVPVSADTAVLQVGLDPPPSPLSTPAPLFEKPCRSGLPWVHAWLPINHDPFALCYAEY